ILDERADIVQQLLAAFDGKGGDDEVAAASERLIDLGLENIAPRLEGMVLSLSAAIGRFGDNVVEAGRRVGLAVEDLLVGPDVARKEKPHRLAPAIAHFDLDGGRAEDVPGVPVAGAHIGPRLEPLAIAHGPA